MKKDLNIELLLKFGQFEHMKSLLEKGQVYMNTVDYFKDLEDDENRADKLEGTSYIDRITNLEILCKNIVVAESKKGQIYFKHENDNGNLFCLTSILRADLQFNEPANLTLSPKLKSIDDYVLLIYNPKDFLKRIDEQLSHLKLRYEFDHVSYMKIKGYTGSYNIFKKPLELCYQKEVRLFVKGVGIEPISFEIGSLKDIAILMSVRDLDKYNFKLTIDN